MVEQYLYDIHLDGLSFGNIGECFEHGIPSNAEAFYHIVIFSVWQESNWNALFVTPHQEPIDAFMLCAIAADEE